jgi:hypothetical protein
VRDIIIPSVGRKAHISDEFRWTCSCGEARSPLAHTESGPSYGGLRISREYLGDLFNFKERSLLLQRAGDSQMDYRPAAFWSRRTIHVEAAFATSRFFSSVMVHST